MSATVGHLLERAAGSFGDSDEGRRAAFADVAPELTESERGELVTRLASAAAAGHHVERAVIDPGVTDAMLSLAVCAIAVGRQLERGL